MISPPQCPNGRLFGILGNEAVGVAEPNIKRSMPDVDASRDHQSSMTRRSDEEIFIVASVAKALKVDVSAVDAHETFRALGFGSIHVFALLGDIEDEFGLEVDPQVVIEFPTPYALALYINGNDPANGGQR